MALYLKYLIKRPFFDFRPLQVQSNVVISLTTSPMRLPQINFNSWPKETRIILNLPLKYRNNESYKLTANVIRPNIYINWLPYDVGPQLKLLGLFFHGNFIPQIRCSDIIVVIDDDTIYANNLLDEYVKAFQEHKEPLVASGKIENIYGNIIQPGYHSYALRARDLDTQKCLEIINLYNIGACKRHDDFLFSQVFKNFTAFKINVVEPLQLPFGFGSDALFVETPSHIKHKECSDIIRHLNRHPNLHQRNL